MTLSLHQSGQYRFTTHSSANVNTGDLQQNTCGDHSETTVVIDGSHNSELLVSIDDDGGGCVSVGHLSAALIELIEVLLMLMIGFMEILWSSLMVLSCIIMCLDYWVNSWRKVHVVWLRGMHYDVPSGAGLLVGNTLICW